MELIGVPEGEGWEYTGLPNDGQAFVCSTYVASLLKAGGIFENFEINA